MTIAIAYDILLIDTTLIEQVTFNILNNDLLIKIIMD